MKGLLLSSLFYFRYAVRALQRGGQRTFLAMLCVAFGVMSVIAMQMLSMTILNTILMPSRDVLGGDALLRHPQQQSLGADDVATFERLRTEGKIEAYSLSVTLHEAMLKPDKSGQVYFLMWSMGVDPATYPLVGEIRLTGAENLASALKESRSAVLSRDLVKKLDLKIGDTFLLTNGVGGTPQRLRLTAIADAVQDHRGDKVLYSLDTARLITGRTEAATEVYLRLGPNSGDGVLAPFEQAGWYVQTPDSTNNQNVQDTFEFMLKGAGILGLLVGGIGVMNTMQVLLARRTTEIAMLKTMGYRQGDLIALFGFETVLLGLIGSILGAIAAILFLGPLMEALERIGSMLLDWSIDPLLLAGGILAGTLTTAIFGIYAIVRASAVRPATLLRHLPVSSTWPARFQTFGLYLILALPFWFLSSVIMGSVLWGAAVIGIAVAGLIGLSFVLGLLLVALGRLPVPPIPLLSLAQNNLRRQKLRAIFALIALCVGVFAIGLAIAMIRGGENQMNSRTWSRDGYNLISFTGHEHSEAIAREFTVQGVQNAHTCYSVPLDTVQVGDDTLALDIAALQGRPDRDITWDLTLTGESWGSVRDGVYLSQRYADQYPQIKIGAPVAVVTSAGMWHTFTVAGFYTAQQATSFLDPFQGLLVSRDAALALAGEQASATIIGAAPVDRLQQVTDNLRAALPEALIVNTAELNDVMARMLKNLFIFAVMVAGLALVAGAVLIANSVGLAMVERRREVGIFKAVGFSGLDVLGTILLEHGLLGLLGGVVGTIGVVLATLMINASRTSALLALEPVPMLATVLIAVGIALGSAVLAAWQPTQVRPLVILRDE